MTFVRTGSLGALAFYSVCALVGGLLSPHEARAVPLPLAGVFAETSAQVQAQTSGPFTASDPLVAAPNDALIMDPTPLLVFVEAQARAEASAFSPSGVPQLRSASLAADTDAEVKAIGINQTLPTAYKELLTYIVPSPNQKNAQSFEATECEAESDW